MEFGAFGVRGHVVSAPPGFFLLCVKTSAPLQNLRRKGQKVLLNGLYVQKSSQRVSHKPYSKQLVYWSMLQ